MVSEEFPAEVLAFLDSCIDSIEQLRVLLLLQSQPSREWTISEITAELSSAERSIAKRLADLYDRKILIRSPGSSDRFRYHPASEEVDRLVQELARQNQMRPYRIIEAIYASPSKTLRAFADAFKLRKDKK